MKQRRRLPEASPNTGRCDKPRVYRCSYWTTTHRKAVNIKLRISPGSTLMGVNSILERYGATMVPGSLSRIY